MTSNTANPNRFTAWRALTALGLLALASGAMAYLNDPLLTAESSFGVLWFNALPIFWLALALLGLTGRIVAALCLGQAFLSFLFLANARKIEHLGPPLDAFDLLLAADAPGNTFAILHNYADFTPASLWVFGILAALALTSLIAERPWVSGRMRLMTLAGMLLLATPPAMRGVVVPLMEND